MTKNVGVWGKKPQRGLEANFSALESWEAVEQKRNAILSETQENILLLEPYFLSDLSIATCQRITVCVNFLAFLVNRWNFYQQKYIPFGIYFYFGKPCFGISKKTELEDMNVCIETADLLAEYIKFRHFLLLAGEYCIKYTEESSYRVGEKVHVL